MPTAVSRPQAAQKVQEEVTREYEEAERALELLRNEGENEGEEMMAEGD